MNKTFSVLFWIAIICVVVVLLTELFIYLSASQTPSFYQPYEIRLIRDASPKYTTNSLSLLYSTIKLLYIPVFIILVFFIVEKFKMHKEAVETKRIKRKESKEPKRKTS